MLSLVNLRFQGCAVPVWSGTQPLLVWYPSFLWSSAGLFCGPRDPLFSLVVRAAAANVNPRTRLSHMTPFIVCDWCTRERCRPMMQNSHIFPEFPAGDSQNFAAGSRISQDFPRIFRQSQTTPRARPHHPHPHH
jgi:hypothetical protein